MLKRIKRQRRFNRAYRSFQGCIPPFARQFSVASPSEKGFSTGPQKIAFIVPGIGPFVGGITSILRLGTYFSKFGHQVDYISYREGDKTEQMISAADLNLPGWQGTVQESSALDRNSYDLGISSDWASCYHLMHHQQLFKRKAYFVQDFEPFFFPMGSKYVLALNSYRMPLIQISLGQWNKKIIESTVPGSSVNVIDFPVEISQYPIVEKTVSLSQQIKFAVYLKDEEKRAPLLLFAALKNLEKGLKEKGYQPEINIFGYDKNLQLPVGRNLGKLSTEQLKKLYCECDFGIVASLSNISLVNYEMAACGLPVIDLIDGSAPAFFEEDEMIFVQSNTISMLEKVSFFLERPDELDTLVRKAQRKIKHVTWERSAQQFCRLLNIKDSI